MSPQSNKKIVYQGEPGANSHIACAEVFPDWEAVDKPSFEDAFVAVVDGSAELAMIPIENTIAGRVADIHHLMPTSGLNIIGEFFLPLQHQLMAVKGATLETVKVAYSHPMALGQCRESLKRLGLIPHIAADTAGAARRIAEANDPTKAAIASTLAAEIYGLDIIAANIADADHNTTRFIILSREPDWAPAGNGPCVTTFVFKVRNVPAALYKAMGGFATNSVNMTKLESYQLEGEFVATQFYADVEGHPDDANVRLALEELAFFSAEVKILGVYPAHPFRFAERKKRG
ncbi:prephenate dehydratase [Flaviflagellibacter deserti]|uniref:prephenate dehydratase n=1 Tax=Flaviflagellibacter deserti TaxID=2267266 RepID=A0ABV9YZ95_9HYPH